ncbi:MAG: hypothetical protein FJ295_15495 [Planctomycetes bacterium]|nr:hypothetical protein [Planctomycetota bacterium]
MKFSVIASILLTAVCWGVYGPVLHFGQQAMEMSRLRAFLCVGLAYFVIAVIAPLVMLRGMETDKAFSMSGVFWSSLAGAAGAVGALGIILAMSNGGKPVYVMPLVFGLAPVVNSFFTIYVNKKWNEISPWFLSGLILVGLGAAMVLFFAPSSGPAHGPPPKKDDAGTSEPPARSPGGDSAESKSDAGEDAK